MDKFDNKGSHFSSYYSYEHEKPQQKVEKEEEVKEKKRFTFRQIVILVLIVSIVGGGALGAGYGVTKYFLIDEKTEAEAKSLDGFNNKDMYTNLNDIYTPKRESAIVNIAEEVGPSVVAITSKVTVSDWFNNKYTEEGRGSGVIFDIDKDRILILTNNHVIDNAQELVVTLNDNEKVPANVIGTDSETDLGIIKVDRADIPDEAYRKIRSVSFGDSDELKAGETAIAIGNPLGYNNTVTVGVISALNRKVKLPDKNLTLIQTDAAINPGNSGGALVNIDGEVIGINTVKIADTEVEGIGFAIPINYAKPVIKELVEKGYVSRPYLGIIGQNIDAKSSQLFEIPIGVIVVDVMKNGAADLSGIKKGDVIISADGQSITSMEQLSNIIRNHEVGEKIEIKVVRNGKEKKEFSVELKEKLN
ncbi:S1C family serine protease [Clostridiisalibacter paucivorans]|uniref:S1C family serine protease n=1 Tax=Clostridiisalibacter paucivorans TaxID=408753 RepID=UPI00068567C6|nr:trypsin-like peptidase domain-containing protein [Clostridiisalibacter paucivorans]